MSMVRQVKRRAKRCLHRHPSLEKFSCFAKVMNIINVVTRHPNIGLRFCTCTYMHLPYISPLDYYKLMGLSPHVLINNNGVITVTFDVVLQVRV